MSLLSKFKSLIHPQFIFVLTFVVMVSVSWQRGISMIVDIGRETDLPFRILNGEMLYRDIHFIYSPFSPYFNALLYWIFGVHLDTLIFSSFLLTVLLTVLCYKISRKILSPTESSIATSMVVVLCFFKPAGNMIFPYSFSAMHAAVFSLTSLLFILVYAENRNKKDLIIAGFFFGLTLIAKQEFAFAVGVTILVFLVNLHRKNLTNLLKDLCFAFFPALLVSIPVYLLLFTNVEWHILIKDCYLFITYIPKSLIFYNRFRSGLDYPLASFIQMIGAAALSIALIVLIVIFSDKTRKLLPQLIFIFIVSVTIASVILFFFFKSWDGSPLRALPFFLSGLIFIEWRRKSKSQNSDEQNLPGLFVFAIAVYSLAILLRVFLRVPSGGFSASFFLPTSLILIAYGFLKLLPSAIQKWTDNADSFIRGQKITQSFCFMVVLFLIFFYGIKYRINYTYPITTPRGSIIVEKTTGAVINETLKFIETNTAQGEFIAVLPEGNDLAFLTGRRINFRHQVLIPNFLKHQDELDAIDALKRDNVRFIFIINRPMKEFGANAFGKDFYQTLGNWIEENYQVIKVFGIPENQPAEIGKSPFFIKVYQRKY